LTTLSGPGKSTDTTGIPLRYPRMGISK